MKIAEHERRPGGFKRFLPRWLRTSFAPRSEPLLARQSGFALGKRVLIVDDDAVVRLVTSRILRSLGYEVVTAVDCSEAIGAVAEARPDVVLLDVNFPPDISFGGGVAWDGLGLMCWLRRLKNTSGARFIIITSSDSEECRQKALDLGAAGFLRKPIEYGALVEALTGAPGPQPGKLTRVFETELAA